PLLPFEPLETIFAPSPASVCGLSVVPIFPGFWPYMPSIILSLNGMHVPHYCRTNVLALCHPFVTGRRVPGFDIAVLPFMPSNRSLPRLDPPNLPVPHMDDPV